MLVSVFKTKLNKVVNDKHFFWDETNWMEISFCSFRASKRFKIVPFLKLE